MKWIVLQILFAFSLFSNEEQVMPGSRPIPEVEMALIQQERANEGEWTKEETVGIPSMKGSDSKVSAFHADVFYSTHNGAYHNSLAVTELGSSVQLEDGSLWKIADGYHYKTLNWTTSDLVVITPNQEWFTTELFRMTNQNTGVSVRCDMASGPIYHGRYTHWIVGINYYTQEIYLEDGSTWEVTGFDSSTFGHWLLNDTIIIGVNDGILSSTKPNILINVNNLTYVRTICVR